MAFIKGQPISGFPFTLVNRTTGAPVTTGTVTGYYLLDGGAQTALSGTATHEGNGQWSWDTIPAAATNGTMVGLYFVHPDAFPVQITIQTTETPYGELIAGMPSEVELCNLALLDLGAETIESLTDDTDRAKLCRHLYPACRDELLGILQPYAAVKRATLAGTTSPLSDWDYAFALPSDLLQILDTDDESYAYEREGATLVTNRTPVTLRYIARLEDVTKYPPHFTRALVAYLTARMTYPITKSAALKQENYRLYELAKEEALTLEGQEGTPNTTINTTLTSVRG